ncbi:hypothetical protein SPRG_19879 [Saprolegnia parasitica CBS 223.65]|uniref:WW domain-containing protein n=1 Tax=Saprolegnia parasitica (strain CBS 223.65) TaxID=695850 RepID=A0A067CRS9_SAPPC|nr:hypothetical protein SPRG_19879 [Saprolegnia parasitica CBS 223.65]KDO29206.1 hypothetical protein SPRG_19879 [Saprolegnia parasitica CBS 223.65]|eukprot:XP_012200106.1 hypothetical protein SPRG_19879 [Saprolegnia parasitica CBS 223.65]
MRQAKLSSAPFRTPQLFHAIAADAETGHHGSVHSLRLLQRLGSSHLAAAPCTPRTATLLRKFTIASGPHHLDLGPRTLSSSRLQLLPHLKDANLCADPPASSVTPPKAASMWSNEPVADPTQWLFTKEEQFESILCRRCHAYLKRHLVQPLPSPWLELPPDGDDATCYYCKRSHEIRWTPPEGTSEVAMRVFEANQSVYAVCNCRMTWERRQHLLRKIKQYSNRYKENVHWSVGNELEHIYDRHFGDVIPDNTCSLFD